MAPNGKKDTGSRSNVKAARSEAKAAWDELLRDLRRYDPDERLQRKLAAVQDAFAPLLADDEPIDEPHDLEHEHERKAAGAHAYRKPQRHDKGSVAPKGYVYNPLGDLVPEAPISGPSDESPEPRVHTIAYGLLRNLAVMFGVRVRNVTPVGWRINQAAQQLEKAYEGLNGHRYGSKEWWEDPLIAQLEMNALRKYESEYREAEDRRRAQKGKPLPRSPEVELLGAMGEGTEPPMGAMDRQANGQEILEYLRDRAQDAPLPVELTGEAIDAMIARAGVAGNRSGGGRKPAPTVVAEFKDRLKKLGR